MAEARDNVIPHSRVRSLRDAIRKVRMSDVERADVVVGLQESERARLEMLGDELIDVFKEVPEDDDQFSFQIVTGTQPRLWIDITSHVVMARDRQTYRFVKDTRLGRATLLESNSVDDMADYITEYIAERILERDKALEADWLVGRLRLQDNRHTKAIDTLVEKNKEKEKVERRSSAPFGILTFCLGLLVGVLLLIGLAWFANPLL
ncbi:hypothetical protein E1162_17205 [Rhodobacteraceae bacterium RKSG542]|uniref:hypothetical protein n=1 Tax=Pseudovibrio flavus TaxID=2529854 RepID=UPI0012BC21FD|nr:hypothetical protein [Pseudovibrio flavus]MTI18983.1 hypothetical protein [Pseudovibrio flavus]